MFTTDLTGAAPGDKLILDTRSRGENPGQPVTVSRVGRVYLYVLNEYGRELRERFRRSDGSEDSHYGAVQRLYTPEAYAEKTERTALFEGLRSAGLPVEPLVRDRLTTDQLRALLAIVTPA